MLHFGHLRFGPNDDPDRDGFPNDEELEDDTRPNAADLVIEELSVSLPGAGAHACGSIVEITPGTTLTLRYVVFNPHSRVAEAILGASLCLPVGERCGTSPGDLFFNDPANDKLVQLPSGRSTQQRPFRLS